jgi:hypothetical protein
VQRCKFFHHDVGEYYDIGNIQLRLNTPKSLDSITEWSKCKADTMLLVDLTLCRYLNCYLGAINFMAVIIINWDPD